MNETALMTAVEVTLDVGASSLAFPHALWQACVGSGHAALGARVDWRAHAKRAVDELGFTGFRMHGWLDDDMSVAPAPGQFHWYNVDLVADYLVELGVRPIMELDYMPRSLTASCKDPILSMSSVADRCTYAFHNRGGYKGLLEPPDDYSHWYALISALATHLVGRYGRSTLRQWHYEVWNEPNPWIGHVDYPAQYEPLFNASAWALKLVDEGLSVGGPTTATLAHIEDFATRATWDRTSSRPRMPLDFVSSHFYPSEANCSDASRPLGRDPDCFVRSVRRASARLAAARAAVGAPAVPFLLTEFNSGLQGGPGTGEAGPHSDTAYAAAFAVRAITQLSEAATPIGTAKAESEAPVDLASWWTFSDLLDEGWLTGAPFYGGFGLLNSQGVAKPAFRAFELLRGAGTRRLAGVRIVDPAPDYPSVPGHSTISVLATIDGDEDHGGGTDRIGRDCGSIGGRGGRRGRGGGAAGCAGGAYRGLQLFLANFAPMAGATGAPWKPRPRNVSLVLHFQPSASSSSSAAAAAAAGPTSCTPPRRATLQRIDDATTAPRGAWEAMGSPSYPNAAQLAALHAASQVSTQSVELTRAGRGAACAATLTVEVAPHGVVHLAGFARG